MPEPRPTGESLEKISLAAAMANAYGRDQQGFAGILAALLEGSLPQHVIVTRKPVRLFASEKRVTQVKVTLGDQVFVLDDPGGGQPSARKIKIVRGITLKTEEQRIDQWLGDLEAAVTEEAEGNEYASAAITDYLRREGL